jgi:UDP-GlcNAc:undecaprenyl-phosphate GlcNAc-1-phosphate transferase
MSIYIIGGILAFSITLLSTPLIKRFAYVTGFVDKPNPGISHKIHKKETPLLGGLAILLGVFTLILVLGGFEIRTLLIISLALVMFSVGLLDDRYGLDYRTRLISQLVIGTVFVVFLFMLAEARPFTKFVIIGLGIFWMVGVTNALNMIDNIDGITAGITALSASTLLLIAIWQSNYLAGIIASALLASALAFLVFNYSPASIFLGDAGTLMIGFLLAATALLELRELFHSFSIKYVAFPFFLGFPIYDTTFATIRRIALKKPIYSGGGSNITYRLLSRKISRQNTVFIEYGLHIFFCILGLFILLGPSYMALSAVAIGFAIALAIGKALF